MIGLQHGSSRKRLEITLITDGDSSKIRYHSPSPYVLSPPFAPRFTIQVKQFKISFITFSCLRRRQQPCPLQPLPSFQLQISITKQPLLNNQEKNPLLRYQFHHL